MKTVRPLVLDLDRDDVPVGEPLAVRVRDGRGKPVADALVASARSEARTGPDGRCRLTFRAPGFRRVVAAKEPGEHVAYEPTSALVRAVTGPTRRLAGRSGARSD